MRVRIGEIVVGERRREEMGDIAGLAESIRQYGLLHPIVIDDERRLVAGERRLRACQLLGWDDVEATPIGLLTDAERRLIELEENVRRKGLTPYELSRNMVQLAVISAKVDRSELRSDSERNSGRGRPAEPGSLRRVSERIGVPVTTIFNAQSHVAAIDAYPELMTLSQSDALKIATKLDAMPAEEKTEARAAILRHDPTTLAAMTDRPHSHFTRPAGTGGYQPGAAVGVRNA